jgi:hypothetical protein
MIIYVFSIVTSIFHLYKSTLHHAVWTLTRCRDDAFCSYKTINDVRTSNVLYYMPVPV